MRNKIQIALKWIFFPKNYKNRPAAGALPSDIHSLRRLGGLTSDPVCDALELHKLGQQCRLNETAFEQKIFYFWFKPSAEQNSGIGRLRAIYDKR